MAAEKSRTGPALQTRQEFRDTVCLTCCNLGFCKIQDTTDNKSWLNCNHFRDHYDVEYARRVLALEKQGRIRWQQKEVELWDGTKKLVSLLPLHTSTKRGFIARNLEFVSEVNGNLRFTGQVLEPDTNGT